MIYKRTEITAPSVAPTAKPALPQYKGFCSTAPGFKLSGAELVRQDLVNHFNTRKGERGMEPTFGSIIWDLLMEPLLPTTRDAIVEDVKTIVNNDPRVRMTKLDIQEEEHGYTVRIEAALNPNNQLVAMTLKFDQRIGYVA